ncbi:glycerol dehydrogenase [Collinsella sp. An2]|uniref:glycerol dehydrogenase n=1 Tax=Collinsella sp. An2 TaxID=1965585 RepID=UPI000B364FCE|nr:glycerol dehydrogenase [Collinsella sp. An2]OUP08929.1 glycerol dehydrogenase [Collinsella sp. An2]
MARIYNSPGKYVQGPDALAELARYVEPLGSKVLALSTPSGIERIGDKVRRGFESSSADVALEAFNGECCDTEIARLGEVARAAGCDVIAGIGGGKVLDTAKAVAYQLNAPVIVCPTAASSDAPCSALSVIYTEDGAFDRYLYLNANPDVVLMDTTVIAAAPPRLIVSGMGDALATYFEAKASVDADGSTCAGGQATAAALALARLCYDTLMADGVKAKLAVEAGCLTPAVEHVIEANTLLSGIGFESCGLAAAHAVHNGLTLLPETHAMLHGEKVAFGALVQLVLEDAPTETIEQVLGFCMEVGLPTTLADLGVEDASRDHLMPVAERACAATDTMGNLPFAVTPAMVCDAIIAADALGRYYHLDGE